MKNLFLVIPTIRQGGGAARVMLNLLNNLDRLKYKITLVVNVLETENMPLLPKDVDIIELGFKKSRFAILSFCRVMYREKPDVVFSTMGHLNILIGTFRWALPSRTMFIARETNTVSVKNKYQPYPRLFDLMYRLFYNNFDKIVAQSNFMKMDLVDNYEIQKDKIVVINNPIDTKSIDQNIIKSSGRETNVQRDTTTLKLIAVGRLSHQKGYDLLCQALVLLDINYHLDIYGTGPELAQLSEIVEGLGLSNNVSFMGYTDNPYEKIASSHLLLLSSRYEGFPNVVLEANYCGVPVVGFDSPGGTAEIIKNGLNGFLVANEDYYGFAEMIKVAAKVEFDPCEIKKLTQLKYGLETILRKYELLFDD